MAKGIPVKCTGIKLRADSKQVVTFEKPASTPTNPLSQGGAVTNDPDLLVNYVVTDPNDGNFSVGKDYTVTIS